MGDTENHCPSCGYREGFRSLLEMDGLTVHTTRLMHTEAAARSFTRGDMRLTLCPHCGFIFNACFDASLQDYVPDSEEAQTASDVFCHWQSQLIRRLIDERDIRGKKILEIGCGKGEFLTELCREGSNQGIGYDPAFRPRDHEPLPESTRIVVDYWSAEAGLHHADVIVCRHTLEHIAPVGKFLADIRRQIPPQKTPLLFFEVPDTRRVLTKTALWDIYYEHCSYFTQETLIDLFERSGFHVDDCWLDFDDQYLLLVAHPAKSAGERNPNAPVNVINPLAERFIADYQRVRLRWQQQLAQLATEGREVVLWGGGSKAAAFLAQVPGAEHVRRVVDINPRKQGKFIPGGGQQVVAPAALRDSPPACVIAMNPIYTGEIAATLRSLGLECDLVALD